MKKQGFTLIELMVVIVIMGILAAVAVPKLFGMIAKSKASEIGPAAGEYIKLQDAYISESGTGIGNWKMIGYVMNSSSNFKYMENGKEYSAAPAAASVELSSGKEKGWQAEAKAALNECAINSQWQLDVSQNGTTGGSAVYSASVTKGKSGGCYLLAPSFEKLDTQDGQIASL